MKRLVSIGVALLFLAAAAAQSLMAQSFEQTPPAWWSALHASNLTQQELAQITFQMAAPIAASPVVPQAPQVFAVDNLPAENIKYQPSVILSGGGGFASPNGKFAYYSISKATGVQNTYLTAAQEYTLVKGQIESCTLVGASKPIYEFGWLDIGLTGLVGGCSSTGGQAAVAGSGQVFALLHFGKSGIGMVLTALKNNTGGYKLTLAPAFAK